MTRDVALRRRTVGLFLRQARIAARLTQEDIAKALCCTQQFVGKLEQGFALPPADRITDLSMVLGIAPKRLIDVIYDYQVKSAEQNRRNLLEAARA
jgi:transcriptional regulator with XRE-family HTH domain